MKILFLIDSLGSGGAQNQISLLAPALQAKGHEVAVLTYFDHNFFKDRLTAGGVEHIFIPKKGKLGLNLFFALRKLQQQRGFDALISFLHTPNFYACLLKRFTRSAPFTVVSYRSKTDFERMSWRVRKQRNWVNKVADHIVANSLHERRRWLLHFPQLADKWTTIYNLVDLAQFQPVVKTGEPRDFICVGAVRPLKNANIVIEALHLLRQKGIKPTVHWYGKSSFEQNNFQSYIAGLKMRITAFELEEQFIWHPPTTDLPSELPDYKALIHPTLLEGLPNVICEALAAGLPVLASNLFDHPKLLGNKERGYLFDPEDAEQLANYMQQILVMGHEQYAAMKIACRRFAEQEFAGEVILAAYEEVLHVA